jgi:hypothetical protein
MTQKKASSKAIVTKAQPASKSTLKAKAPARAAPTVGTPLRDKLSASKAKSR